MKHAFRNIAALAVAAALWASSAAAHAEGRIRIAEQFGIVYLLLNVAQDQKLIEKGPSSFRVEPNSHNRWSWSSPVGMWAGCL